MSILYWLGADASSSLKQHYGVESTTADYRALVRNIRARYCYWVWLDEGADASDQSLVDTLTELLPHAELSSLEDALSSVVGSALRNMSLENFGKLFAS